VPAVIVGDRGVHGWNPRGYADLLGVTYKAAEQLAPRALAARLDQILEATQGLIGRFGAAQLDVVPPERKRTVRDLGYHVFRIGLSFIDAMDQGKLPESWFDERAPAEMRDGGDVARWGALARGRITGWFQGAGDDEFARVVDVYYGPQGAHDLLERTTWHCGQHLRQLHILAGRAKITPLPPLNTALFTDLPLPDAIW
jgi:hypothetical protein